MKNLLFAVLLFASVYGFSQTGMPVFKKGTKLNYDIVTNDGTVQLAVNIDSLTSNYVKYKWTLPSVGTGTWIVKEKSLQSAMSGRWGQLEPDTDVTLPDDESVGMLSKAQWMSIQQNKKLVLDMVNYTQKSAAQPSKLNSKAVDALYFESDNGTSKIWVLNNAVYPAIIKLTGNTAGPDVELKTVE